MWRAQWQNAAWRSAAWHGGAAPGTAERLVQPVASSYKIPASTTCLLGGDQAELLRAVHKVVRVALGRDPLRLVLLDQVVPALLLAEVDGLLLGAEPETERLLRVTTVEIIPRRDVHVQRGISVSIDP